MPGSSLSALTRRLGFAAAAGLIAFSFAAAARRPVPIPVPRPSPEPVSVRGPKPAPVQDSNIPDFDSNGVAWIAINSDFTPVPGGPAPVTYDPKYPFRRNDEPGPATYRVADLANPNLKPWVKEALRQSNELVFQGKVGATPRWSCLPGGVPGFSLFVVEPVYVVQGPKEVLLIYSGNHEVRHVYLGVPHSKNPKPSWYGESIGHYEGDTLVIDTIGLSQKAVIDNYHTPHTDRLHVLERWHLVDDGKTLQTDLEVDDPGAFYQPWKAVQRYRRVADRGMLPEENCSENNGNIFHLPGWVPSPQADTPDF
jgi:hypothetical protein